MVIVVLSVTWTENVYFPGTVGVPLITPEFESTLIPLGRDPDVVNRKGAVPPIGVNDT